MASRTAAYRAISALAIALWTIPPLSNATSSAVGAVDFPSRADRTATSLQPTLMIEGASHSQLKRLTLALHRFTGLGLALPDLEIRFVDRRDSCQGHMGLFETAPQPWRITICSEASFLYEHELAHAWEHANLTDAERMAFMEVRGRSTWSDPDVPWSERGVEDVAFVVQRGLAGLLPPILHDEDRALLEAFELLTGRPAPILGE